MRSEIRPRLVVALFFAVGLGVLMAIASNAWEWSGSTKFLAGIGMAAMLGLVVTPLVVLPIGIRREGGKLRFRGPSARTRR